MARPDRAVTSARLPTAYLMITARSGSEVGQTVLQAPSKKRHRKRGLAPSGSPRFGAGVTSRGRGTASGIRGRARSLAAVAAVDSRRDPGDVIRSARGREVFLAGNAELPAVRGTRGRGRRRRRPGVLADDDRPEGVLEHGRGEGLACADGRAAGQIVSAILPVTLPDSSSSWALAASARPRVAWRCTRSFPDSARSARASRAG